MSGRNLEPTVEADRIKFLKSLFDGKYDIFLAQDIDNAELGRQKAPFYDKIAQIGERTGHKVFVPWHHVKFPGDPEELDARDTYVLITNIMIPQAKLFLCYLGINSYSVGSMDASAKALGKDQILFYEKTAKLETVAEVQDMVFGFPRETRKEILEQPRILFHRDPKTFALYKYPSIREILEFESEAECLERLEKAIMTYFSK